MSIITEALTKAQEKRKNGGYQKTEAKPVEEKIIKIQTNIPDIKMEAKPIGETKPSFSIKSLLMVGLIVAASAVILILIPFTHKPEVTTSKPVDSPTAQISQPQQVAEVKAIVPYKFNLMSPTFEFSLEGIISGNGAPAAIINKQVVGVGDTVKGAVVMDIKEDEVLLDYNGEELVLQIQ